MTVASSRMTLQWGWNRLGRTRPLADHLPCLTFQNRRLRPCVRFTLVRELTTERNVAGEEFEAMLAEAIAVSR